MTSPEDRARRLLPDDAHDSDSTSAPRPDSPSRINSTTSITASGRIPLPSPEATYTSASTQHYSDYPMSSRERRRMSEDMADPESMLQAPGLDAAIDVLGSGDEPSRNQRQASLQQPPSFRTVSFNDSIIRTHVAPGGQYAMEVEEEEVVHKFPIRSTIIAIFLLLVGLTCLIIGIVNFALGIDRVFAFVLIGAILIIPGGYQCYVIWSAWRGRPGFSFAQLAPFEG